MRGEFSDSGAERGNDAVARAAAQWLARRDRGLTPLEAEELRRWRGADPLHAAEWERIERTWHSLDQARSVPELVALAQNLERATAGRRFLRWSSVRPALAAAAAVALAGGLLWWRMPWPMASPSSPAGAGYEVLASDARRLVLEDGSVADIRGQGEVQIEFTAAERRLRLVSGEAHFQVTTDPARPFIVRAGGVDVRAVGTAFNVRLAHDNIEVLVTEGTVRVAGSSELKVVETPLLAAGQQAVVRRALDPEAVPRIDIRRLGEEEIEESLSWQNSRLVFHRTPLMDAVEAFNREASGRGRARLVIGDPKLRTKRMGGTFRASNVEGFVRLLELTAEVRAERADDEIVLWSVQLQ